MSKFSRRGLIASGLSTVAGASALAVATRIASRYSLIPPDSGKVLATANSGLGAVRSCASVTAHSYAFQADDLLPSRPTWACVVPQ